MLKTIIHRWRYRFNADYRKQVDEIAERYWYYRDKYFSALSAQIYHPVKWSIQQNPDEWSVMPTETIDYNK